MKDFRGAFKMRAVKRYRRFKGGDFLKGASFFIMVATG